jgi:hypothetical protein
MRRSVRSPLIFRAFQNSDTAIQCLRFCFFKLAALMPMEFLGPVFPRNQKKKDGPIHRAARYEVDDGISRSRNGRGQLAPRGHAQTNQRLDARLG